MRIVIAPDKFKGSLSAPEVAEHVAAGIRSVDQAIVVDAAPVADGGEGTIDAAVAAGFTLRTTTVAGPIGAPVVATFAVRGAEAVIEMAQASGLAALPDGTLHPLDAGTRGTGQLIRAALDAGCTRIVIGVGGSAGTDGGSGLLQGLGVRLLDAHGAELPGGGAALARLATVDTSGLDPRVAQCSFVLASDVDNPLTGPTGAAAVFGAQKGASADDIALLDDALEHFVAVLADTVGARASLAADAPGAGAAGGTGFAALAMLGAQRESGIDVVLELTDLASRLAGADLVITGEGSLDEQSLFGKTPVGVAQLAAAHGVPVYAVCGRTTLDDERLRAAGFERTFALTDLESDVDTCIRDAARLLETLGARIARLFVGRAASARNERRVSTTGGDGRATEPTYDLVIRAERILTPEGTIAAELGVRDGVIAAIKPVGTEPAGTELTGTHVIELADDETLIPGLVDTHVHVNEPGRTEWEGFASATRAAAAGGVTTIIDMPLNSIPPTTTVEALHVKRDIAAGQAFVDVGFWGGAIPGNRADLLPLYREGVFGFKCFLLHSGVDEFPPLTPDELEDDLTEIAQFGGRMIVHAEDADTIEHAPHRAGASYSDFLASRPDAAEMTAIATVIERARRTGASAHILHLSSAGALHEIAEARADGVALTAETCPHYLTLTAEEIPDGATAFKCCPPIRSAANRDRLWDGLVAGTIDCIVSDHSPSTRDLKQPAGGDFQAAWGGISSLQLGLSLVWTEANRRGIHLERVVEWMATRPADLVGLGGKGRIAVGADADFSIFAPDDSFTVDAQTLLHKNHVSAYDTRQLSGVVRSTYLRGRRIDATTPAGRLIRRPDRSTTSSEGIENEQ